MAWFKRHCIWAWFNIVRDIIVVHNDFARVYPFVYAEIRIRFDFAVLIGLKPAHFKFANAGNSVTIESITQVEEF